MGTLKLEGGVEVKYGDLINIKASQIVKNADTLTLRQVDKTSKEYELLKESIGTPRVRETKDVNGETKREIVCPHGLLNAICVRPLQGEPGRYALVEGGHRHAAWTELFGDSMPIPAHVVDLNEIQTMEAQIEGNFHIKKTKNTEFVQQVKRLLAANPLRTIEEQADRLHMDAATLRQWLGLAKLTGTKFVTMPDDSKKSVIAVAVDDGSLPLSAAFVISTATDGVDSRKQFWAEKQDEFFKHAIAASESKQPQAIAKFCMEATHTIREIKKALKEQKDPNAIQIETPPIGRKLGEMKVELSRQLEVVLRDREDKKLQKQIEELGAAYPDALAAVRKDGYLSGIQYALQVDEETLAQRKRDREEALQAKKDKQDDKKAGSKAAAVARSAGMFGRRLATEKFQ